MGGASYVITYSPIFLRLLYCFSSSQKLDFGVEANFKDYCVFWTIRCTPPKKKIWEENGGVSYSLNVAYLPCWGWGCGSGAGSQEAGAGLHFLLQKFFSYFPPLKPRCVLWSGVSYSPKNTVSGPTS